MLIRVSFMVLASVAALMISQTKTKGTIKSAANKESSGSDLAHEFGESEIQNDEEKQIEMETPQNLLTGETEVCSKVLIGAEKMEYATEREMLQNLIKKYKQREVTLERKLVELNSVKEEQSEISQIERELEKKSAKLDSLVKTLTSLKTENKIIQEKIREDVMCKVELEIANEIVNKMQRKRDANRSHVKDQILLLQEQVVELRKCKGLGGNVVNKKLEEAQEMELEVLELRRRNKEVELEKREMGIKLATAQARFRTEEETMAQIQEEITGLHHVHEELSEQVERLQKNKFNMVQELVYQRWLYTCLRYELHNHQNRASGEYCSHNSDKELYAKTHALTSDSDLVIISSNESDEIETTTLGSSSSSLTSISSKNSSLISKMKRWKITKDYNKRILPSGGNSPGRLRRRFSMSKVESDLSKPRNSDGDSPVMNPEKPTTTRLKRVSFSDSVKPFCDKDMCYVTNQCPLADQERTPLSSEQNNMAEVVEDVTDVKETNSEQIVKMKSTITSLDEHKAEESDELYKSNENVVGNSIKNDYPAENEGMKNQIGHSDDLCSKNELVGSIHKSRIRRQLVQLLAFLFFWLILLLAYFRIK